MAIPKIGQLLVKLDKLLDRYVESGTDVASFERFRAFTWDGARHRETTAADRSRGPATCLFA